MKVLLVTSPGVGEGKTTTVVNLAISTAREGKSVVVVDLDLRHPSLHRIFDIEGHKGLTHLPTGEASLEEVLVSTAVEGLSVVPSGPIPSDPGAILRSPEVDLLIQDLKKRADLVILDSPPVLAVTDAVVLSSKADGALLVVGSFKANRLAVRHAAESLRQTDLPLVGTVINKVYPPREYSYYRHKYAADGAKHRRSRVAMLWGARSKGGRA